DYGTLTVSTSTFAGNSATGSLGGGGIENGATATLNGNIVVGNSGGDLAGVNVASSSSFNLVGSGTLGLSTSNGNQLGVSPANAHLAPLGSYGGPTQTFALLPGSLALGKGATLPAGTTDQPGFARPQGSASDAGAFQSGALVVNTAAESDGTGLLTLRDAVAIADADTTTTALPITFDPTAFAASQTITLTGGTLTLGGAATVAPISITGPSAGVTISGNNSARVFAVNGSTTATLSGLTITHGNAGSGSGGGILNSGTLTVSASTFTGHSAANGGGTRHSRTL